MANIDVEVAGLTKRFGAFAAVEDVSFSIRRGEFFSLLGPSGCGKTTIMRMIAGFEQPTAGTIRIAGEDMAGRRPFERPTNLVFQHLSLFPHMTVAGNIAFGLQMKKTPRRETEKSVGEMLDLVQLSGFGGRKIPHLSGGQKQRVAIARALINRPAVLLLDEPLGALDLKLREQMQLELKRIQREVGTTFIYVTHDQKEAITMSNQIAVVNNGRIEQIDSAAEIYERPQTPFVANFIGQTNLLKGRLSGVGGGAGVADCGGFRVRVVCGFPARAGENISLSVRPEKIRFAGNLPEGANRIAAEVDDVIFLGSLMHYRLALAGGITLTAEAPKDGSLSLARGDKLEIGWLPEDGSVFADKKTE